MRIFMMLTFLMMLEIASAQEAQAVQIANETIDLKEALAKQYNAANMDELLDLGSLLPISASALEESSEEWILDRKKSIGLYLEWYQKMFAAGFKLDGRAIIGAESERNIQKNRAIKSYLIAEQRIKQYMNNNYKGNKKKQFKMEMMSFGSNYDITIEKISNKILRSKFGFIVYDKNVRVE